MPSKAPIFTLDLEIDDIQSEKICIFSREDINPKLSHFFKTYSINNPEFKKKLFTRVMRFFELLDTQNLFSNPLGGKSPTGEESDLTRNSDDQETLHKGSSREDSPHEQRKRKRKPKNRSKNMSGALRETADFGSRNIRDKKLGGIIGEKKVFATEEEALISSESDRETDFRKKKQNNYNKVDIQDLRGRKQDKEFAKTETNMKLKKPDSNRPHLPPTFDPLDRRHGKKLSFSGYNHSSKKQQPQITINNKKLEINKESEHSRKEAIYRREETQEYFKKTTFRNDSHDEEEDQAKNYQSQKLTFREEDQAGGEERGMPRVSSGRRIKRDRNLAKNKSVNFYRRDGTGEMEEEYDIYGEKISSEHGRGRTQPGSGIFLGRGQMSSKMGKGGDLRGGQRDSHNQKLQRGAHIDSQNQKSGYRREIGDVRDMRKEYGGPGPNRGNQDSNHKLGKMSEIEDSERELKVLNNLIQNRERTDSRRRQERSGKRDEVNPFYQEQSGNKKGQSHTGSGEGSNDRGGLVSTQKLKDSRNKNEAVPENMFKSQQLPRPFNANPSPGDARSQNSLKKKSLYRSEINIRASHRDTEGNDNRRREKSLPRAGQDMERDSRAGGPTFGKVARLRHPEDLGNVRDTKKGKRGYPKKNRNKSQKGKGKRNKSNNKKRASRAKMEGLHSFGMAKPGIQGPSREFEAHDMPGVQRSMMKKPKDPKHGKSKNLIPIPNKNNPSKRKINLKSKKRRQRSVSQSHYTKKNGNFEIPSDQQIGSKQGTRGKMKSSREFGQFQNNQHPMERATAPTRENPLKHLLNRNPNDYGFENESGYRPSQGYRSNNLGSQNAFNSSKNIYKLSGQKNKNKEIVYSGSQRNDSRQFEAPSFRSENTQVFQKKPNEYGSNREENRSQKRWISEIFVTSKLETLSYFEN